MCLCSNSCQESLFWTPFVGYKAKNKTGNSTDKDRKGKKGLEILNRDAQNDGFSSISIRLSKELRQQPAVQVQIIPSGPVVVQSPLSWGSKAADCNFEPQCSWGAQAYYFLLLLINVTTHNWIPTKNQHLRPLILCCKGQFWGTISEAWEQSFLPSLQSRPHMPWMEGAWAWPEARSQGSNKAGTQGRVCIPVLSSGPVNSENPTEDFGSRELGR